MRNDDLDLRADRDELHDYAPRAPQAKRQKSLVLQVALEYSSVGWRYGWYNWARRQSWPNWPWAPCNLVADVRHLWELACLR